MSDWMEMHALADGQLDGAGKADAEAKLNQNPALKAEYESVLAVKGVLQAKAEPVTCEKTWKACQARLAELDGRKHVENVVGRYSWGLCTLFLAIILGAGMFNRVFKADGIGTGDAARMISGLAPVSRNDVQSVDMKSWIKPKPQKQIRLVSQAVGRFQGHPVALYNLEDPEGKLSVLEIQGISVVDGVEPMLENQDYSVGKLNGTNCVTWSEESGTTFVVANRPYERLAEVATELRQE